MNTLRKYAMGLSDNLPIQQAVDYGTAGLIGAGAQQLNNIVLGGSDPNPLLSGLLAAPFGASLIRGGRTFLSPEAKLANTTLQQSAMANPYERNATYASMAGALAGSATSLYNTVAGGADVDNNMITIPAALLTGAFPLVSSLMRGNPAINRGNMFGAPSGRTYDYHSVPKEGYVRDPNPDNRYRG